MWAKGMKFKESLLTLTGHLLLGTSKGDDEGREIDVPVEYVSKLDALLQQFQYFNWLIQLIHVVMNILQNYQGN